MRYVAACLLGLLLVDAPAWALDKILGAATNTFHIVVTDTSAAHNGIAGLTLTELVGKVQSLYGKRKDEVEREVDEWRRTLG